MIVNAAIFTCSICGEASVNICSYCTKDACSNHRCERCKRCSHCCECEFPLSAEEPVAVGTTVTESVPAPEVGFPASEALDLEDLELEAAELEAAELEAHDLEGGKAEAQAPMSSFLTPAESSVFAEERGVREPWGSDSNVFAEEEEESTEVDDSTELSDEIDVPDPDRPAEPRE
jgi:hypothetical protein